MKIGINATCYNETRSGGRQRFSKLYSILFRELKEHEFIIYAPKDCSIIEWFSKSSNLSQVITPLSSKNRVQRYLHGLTYWRNRLRHDKIDIYEAMHLPIITNREVLSVLTIHDIRYMNQTFAPLHSLIRYFYESQLNMVDHIITVSRTMKHELNKFAIKADISVIYNGIDLSMFNDISHSDTLAFRKKYDLFEKFVLTVGHLEKRKNFLLLIEAIKYCRDRGARVPLVIIGNDAGLLSKITGKIRDLGVQDLVKIMTNISDQELKIAYKAASAFVFPSKCEGFGIPVLEAMAAGLPLLLSNIDVFKEITEGHSLYHLLDDPRDLGQKLLEIMYLSHNAESKAIYNRERVSEFDFEQLGKDLVRLYEKLIDTAQRRIR